MKIVVCVKRSVDTEAVIALGDDGGISTSDLTYIIDPYSEFAVEKAVQLKESQGAEVVAVCLGGQDAISVLRHALAMGCDSAVLIDDEIAAAASPARKAAVLSDAIGSMGADLVMGGCRSSDTGRAQVMVRIAALLGLPHVNTVIGFDCENGVVHAEREIDDGIARIDVVLPAVLCAQQGLADPRYPTVRDIMQSKRKPVDVLDVATVDGSPETTTARLSLKPTKAGGRIVEGDSLADVVAEVVRLVRVEAKAL